jgi:hypothetical protein
MASPDSSEIEAWHEAGHAVVAHLLGGRIVSVTLEPEEDGYGARSAIEWGASDEAAVANLSGRVALAGPIAEVERFGGHELDDVHVLAAWEADWQEIERCAAVLEREEEGQKRVMERWAREVRTMLLDPGVEELVARVADALEAHGELDETLFEDCLG